MTVEVPLSTQQEVFLAWMHESTPVQHPAPCCAAIRITDEFDVDLLRRGLRTLAGRHETLRTVFRREGPDGTYRAFVLDATEPAVEHVVAPGAGPAERLAAAREMACRERERPFDVAAGPMVRALVIALGEHDHLLVLCVHHLVFDDMSMGVLLRELGIEYSGLRTGRPRRRRVAPTQSSDVVGWSRASWPAHRTSWQRMLTDAPPALVSFPGREPTDRIVPAFVPFTIDESAASGVRATARSCHATPFMVLLAAWSTVLAARSGATDLVVMSPVSGRALPGSETAMGCLFVPLLIRVDLSGEPEFPELVRRVRGAVLRASTLAAYPYDEFRQRFAHAPCVGYYSGAVPLHLPGLSSAEFTLPPQLVADTEIPGSNLGVPQLSIVDRQAGAMPARLIFNAAAFAPAVVEELAQELRERVGHTCRPDD